MNLWYLITLIGSPEMWIFSTGVFFVAYMLFRNRLDSRNRGIVKKLLFVYMVSIWLTLGIVFGLKGVVNIQRPCVPCGLEMEECNPYCLADNSFPSGHAAIIFAVFSSIYINFKKKWFWPFFTIPVVVSVSRYFLVVHYMTDIVFGTVIGVFIPLFVLAFYEKKF